MHLFLSLLSVLLLLLLVVINLHIWIYLHLICKSTVTAFLFCFCFLLLLIYKRAKSGNTVLMVMYSWFGNDFADKLPSVHLSTCVFWLVAQKHLWTWIHRKNILFLVSALLPPCSWQLVSQSLKHCVSIIDKSCQSCFLPLSQSSIPTDSALQAHVAKRHWACLPWCILVSTR